MTAQMLEQLLMDSQLAQDFFSQAQAGLMFDGSYHSLVYDQLHDRFLTHTSQSPDETHSHPHHELISRIHSESSQDLNFKDMNYKDFVSLCLQDYQKLQQDIEQLRQLESQKHGLEL